MKHWHWYHWFILCLLGILLTGIVAYVSYLECSYSVLRFGIRIGIILAIVSVCYIIAHTKNKRVHFHHYLLGALICIFAAYPSPVATILNAVGAGLLVDGACSWGYDPIII